MTKKVVEQVHTITKKGLLIKPQNAKDSDEGVVISHEEVAQLAKYFCPIVDMAKYFGVSRDTIHKFFTDTIKKAQIDVKQSLRSKQIEIALKGDKTMLIWLGKNYLDQSDTGVKNDDDKQPLPWSDDA